MLSANCDRMRKVSHLYICTSLHYEVSLILLFLKGITPQAEALARGIKEKMNELRSSIASAIVAADKAGTTQTAHTVAGRLEQANKWLLNPQHDDKGLGQRAIALIIHEGKKVRTYH